MKETYACAPDAEAALKQFINKNAYEHLNITGQVANEEKRKPGRPGKNSPISMVYRLQIEVSLDQEAVQRTRQRLSCFITITSLDQSYSPREVLK